MKENILIRNELRDGDLKEICDLHGSVYSEEYGFDREFAKYVKETLDDFDRPHSDRERVWIVEKDEKIMGCLAVVEQSVTVAQVRWFLVHPSLRGQGIGSGMFEQAVEFMKEKGYRSAFLTTQDLLHDAARIYLKYGFDVVWEKSEHLWGKCRTSQRYKRRF